MQAESYNLLYFFNELIKIGHRNMGKPGWGHPCDHLIESLVLTRDKFIKKIEGDYTRSSHEFRLNGAGLKMHWEVVREKKMLTRSGDDNQGPIETNHFICTISGDQAKDYPEFVEKARKFLKDRGVCRHDFEKRRRERWERRER